MIGSLLVNPLINLLINHIWQSSGFAVLAGLVAFLLRGNSAKVRYWVWLTASLKFFLPFALLVNLGSLVPRAVPVTGPVFSDAVVQIAVPFSPVSETAVLAHASLHWVPVAVCLIWAVGFFVIAVSRWRGWLRVRAALLAGTPIELPIPVRALVTAGAEEPGVVGFLRPVLVLPRGLMDHLNPRQLDAVLAHEMCHVRRRDNFFAAVHMLVEAVFWFHPLVWWIGSRMVEERELACDEEVLRMGCEAADYVEGILKVCRFYTESPLPCVSGVTGADLKRRLRAILDGRVARDLTLGKRAVLVAMGLAILSIPVAIGVLTAPIIRAQNTPPADRKFDVVSIKLDQSRSGRTMNSIDLNFLTSIALHPRSGKFRMEGPASTPLSVLIQLAYNVADFQIQGIPAWGNSERYSIAADAEGGATFEQMRPMIRSLLADRFQLTLHRETRELPIYQLTVAKGGLRIVAAKEGSCIRLDPDHPPLLPAPGAPRTPICGGVVQEIISGGKRIQANAIPMAKLIEILSGEVGRTIVDKTGFAENFDSRLDFSPDALANGDSDTATTSIFSALQDQLGLRLESAKGPVEVLVIDRVERPSEN